MHGIYNTSDRAALQQYAVGRAALQFRKWLRPGAIRRFEGIEKLVYDPKSPYKKADYNERLMSEVEGNYITTAKFIVTMFKEARQLNFEFGKRYKELPAWQKSNLKRALGEIAFLMLLLILLVLLSALVLIVTPAGTSSHTGSAPVPAVFKNFPDAPAANRS